MANYYYVKAGGISSGASDDGGRSATKLTTSFTTMGTGGYYDSLFAVFNGGPATAPTAGDIICVSDAHAKSYTVNTILAITDGTLIYSVDDTAASVYKRGASEITSGTFDLTFFNSTISKAAYSKGVEYISGDDITACTGEHQKLTLEDCLIGFAGTGTDKLTVGGKDDTQLVLKNVNMTAGSPSQYINILDSTLIWTGGSLDSSINVLTLGSGSSGSAVIIEDVNLVNLNTAISTNMSQVGNDMFTLDANRVTLASGVVLDSSTPVVAKFAEVRGNALKIGSDTNGFSSFYLKNYVGEVSKDTETYRIAGVTDQADGKFSAAMVGNTNVSIAQPLAFELSNFFVDTDDYTGSITFEVAFCIEGTSQPAVINNSQFHIEVEHADGADDTLGVVVSSAGTPLDATNHTTTTGEWAVDGAFNIQMTDSVTVSIGGSAGNIASGVVRVNAYLTINVDSIQAGDLFFVCRKVDVS